MGAANVIALFMQTLTFGLTLFLLKRFSGLYGILLTLKIVPFAHSIRALGTAVLTFWLARVLALGLLAYMPPAVIPAGRRMLQAGIALYVLLGGPFVVGLQTPFLRELLASQPGLMQGLSILEAWLTPVAEYLLCAGLILPFAGLRPDPLPEQAARRHLNRLLGGLGMALLLWPTFGASTALLRWCLSPQAVPDVAVTLLAWLTNGAIVLVAVAVFLTLTPAGRRIGHSLPERDLMQAGILLSVASIAVVVLPAFLPVQVWMLNPLHIASLLCDNAAGMLLLIAVGRMVLAARPRTGQSGSGDPAAAAAEADSEL